jgi:hypothetical protein
LTVITSGWFQVGILQGKDTKLMKKFVASLILLVAMGFTGAAFADEVSVDGFTMGRFNADSFSLTADLNGGFASGGLTYTAGTFGESVCTGCGTTSSGFLGIGGVFSNNLGYFSLGGDPEDYNGNTFELSVTFTLPTGIVGSDTALYGAVLTGSVSVNGGGITIDFDNTPINFTFVDGGTSGSFQLVVNDVSVTRGLTSVLTGDLQGRQSSAIPEPASMILLGSGLIGAGSFVRRKLGV